MDSSSGTSVVEKEQTKEQAAFLADMQGFKSPEEKIDFALKFLKGCLSQDGAPRFRDFWFARKEVMALFKQEVDSAIRSRLWEEFIQLTTEVRKLKGVLEEQSAFAIEQIELALQVIEQEFADLESQVSLIDLSHVRLHKMLARKEEPYFERQKRLQVLSGFASKLSALRKEVLQTDMRIRFKSKLLKRLSDLGDQIFPQRKEQMEELSQMFDQDVEQFIQKNFPEEGDLKLPPYVLRQDIKALQGMSKYFTLTSQVFHRTRLRLSQCWDFLKEVDLKRDELTEEEAEKRAQEIQVIEEALASLETEDGMTLHALDQKLESIQQKMRILRLKKEEVIAFKERILKIRSPLVAAQEKRALELAQIEKEKLEKKRAEIEAIKQEIALLKETGAQLELEVFQQRFEEAIKSFEALKLSKIERQQLERFFRPVQDLLNERKEQSLLSLSEDDLKALESLRSVLSQKKTRRQEVKKQLEIYRKTVGSSGLDFEKAMHYQELVSQEKESLAKLDAGIGEIEERIASLEA